MKIRRYVGKDTQEAMWKVKMDLGSEAVILNTRKIKQKGLFKMFSKPMVEVLAAVDEFYSQKVKTEPVKSEVAFSVNSKTKEFDNKLIEKEEKLALLENKVNSMENVLQKIYEQVSQDSAKPSPKEMKPEEKEKLKAIELFYNNLVRNEVDGRIAKQLMDAIQNKVPDTSSINDVGTILYKLISGLLGKPQTLKLREDGKPTVVIFVGPTGVGKTTTLAKIAADYSLNHKKKVGLITADTYRIAAVEQLKTYGEILGIPVEVIYSINEIHDAMDKYKDKDIILIDTAGRSHRNKTQFDELKMLVEASSADEIFLVLSTTTGMRNCREILASYSFLKDYKLIFTKLDETPSLGIILNARRLTNKNLSYVTVGQSVPDDIEVANVDKIAKKLIGSIS
ncbi:flagellar biosynthesis protein FlhF [Acetivibrio clariflavus]|uniref:flagellar biosynthesis protein FlhF n=1 Tax=Acetivibrio clariflavus TaxID=288965 RepID=UPI000482D72C|nr:flagellar biosynthesis protein FlhF [Acetivibrio clariflavus]